MVINCKDAITLAKVIIIFFRETKKEALAYPSSDHSQITFKGNVSNVRGAVQTEKIIIEKFQKYLNLEGHGARR
jgi:hypothetical protein